jgi:6-phosphofructokinase
MMVGRRFYQITGGGNIPGGNQAIPRVAQAGRAH